MTTAPESAGSSSRWCFGPLPDLLLGGGLLYVLLFALLFVVAEETRAIAPLALLPLVTLFTGVPHYGATLLRVCDRPEDRRAYAVVTIGASLAAIAVLAVGLRSVAIGSWLLTLYLTWSPWHYSGQNYGIALMFLRRRGVQVDGATKRALHLSFVLSFALIALSIHGVAAGSDYAPVQYRGTVYSHIPLGIPDVIRDPAIVALALAYLGSLFFAAASLLRRARVADLAPAAAVVLSQGLWFAAPALARFFGVFQDSGPLSANLAPYALVWIGVAHSIQYLWVTSYFARKSSPDLSSPDSSARVAGARFALSYGTKALALGAALWVVPAIVFAPGVFGGLPFDAGLAVMIAAAVNLHHFVLDGVIWKLRDGRISRVLVRGEVGPGIGAPSEMTDTALPRARRLTLPGIRATVLTVGLGCAAIFGYGTLEMEFAARPALERRDLAAALRAAEHLRWIGRDSAPLRTNIGLLAAERGELDLGIAQMERALALQATADVWMGLGSLLSRGGRHDDSIDAYREVLLKRPLDSEAANNLAWELAVYRGGHPESVSEALKLARSASAAFRDRDPTVLDTLSVAHAAAGNFAQAKQVSRRALRLAREKGDLATVAEIQSHLELYRTGQPYRGTE